MNYEWSNADEERLRSEALDSIKKKEEKGLAWGDTTLLGSMITELEHDNEGIERDIRMVTGRQLDVIRQSKGSINNIAPEAEELEKHFNSLGEMISNEGRDAGDFGMLRKVTLTRDRLGTIISTAETLLSLTNRVSQLSDSITNGERPDFLSICEELKPINDLRHDLESSKNPSATRFSQHFEILDQLLRDLIDRIRIIFKSFSETGFNMCNVDSLGGNLDQFMSYQHQLEAAIVLILSPEYKTLLGKPNLYQPDDDINSKTSDGGIDIVETSMCWVTQGLQAMWVQKHGLHQSEFTQATEIDVLEATGTDPMLSRLTEWIRSTDGLVSYLVLPTIDDDREFKTSPWKSEYLACLVVKHVIDTIHSLIIKLLQIWSQSASQLSLSCPETMRITKWISRYESGLKMCYSDLKFDDCGVSLPIIETTEGNRALEDVGRSLLSHANKSIRDWLIQMIANQGSVIRDLLIIKRDVSQHNGKYYSASPVDFLYLITTQIKEISCYKDRRADETLSTAVNDSITQLTKTIREGCKKEYWQDLITSGKLEGEYSDHGEHRLRVLCTYANDLQRLSDEMPTLKKQFTEAAAASGAEVFDFETISSQTLLQEADSVCIQICEFVMELCEGEWTDIFADSKSSNRNPDGVLTSLITVLTTIQDFHDDLNEWLHEIRFKRVCSILISFVELEYIQHFADALYDKSLSLKPQVASWLRSDQSEINSVFSSMNESCSESIKILSLMVESTAHNWVLAAERMMKAFPDTPSSLGILLATRSSLLDKDSAPRCVQRWKDLVAATNRDEDDIPIDGPRTLMREIKISEVKEARFAKVRNLFKTGKLKQTKEQKNNDSQPARSTSPTKFTQQQPVQQQQQPPPAAIDVSSVQVTSLGDFLSD